jgi:hypothetical protein
MNSYCDVFVQVLINRLESFRHRIETQRMHLARRGYPQVNLFSSYWIDFVLQTFTLLLPSCFGTRTKASAICSPRLWSSVTVHREHLVAGASCRPPEIRSHKQGNQGSGALDEFDFSVAGGQNTSETVAESHST